MTSPFGRQSAQQSRRLRTPRSTPPRLLDATLRDFSGGLNLIDNDLTMRTRYAVALKNMHRDLNGAMSMRHGTKVVKQLADVAGITAADLLLDMVYFRDKLVMFHTTGIISTRDNDNAIAVIWNAAIAALLPGAPAGWSSGLTQIDTTEFRNELVVCNGVDKPILISRTHTVTYLQDIPTGSNIFTPIGKYCTTVGNYTVIGGVSATPNTIYISAAGTSGTWPGDPAPNDATSINVDAYVARTGGDIVGLSSFRNLLLVHFKRATVSIVLGEYTGTTHVPRVSDIFNDYGLLSHRTVNELTNEVIFADELGVHTVRRNLLAGTIEAISISELVRPQYPSLVSNLDADRLKCFSVYNRLEKRVYYSIYKGGTIEWYCLSFDEDFKKLAWSRLDDWSFTCGAQSVLGRVFFGNGTMLYQYGNTSFSNEHHQADFIDEYDSDWLTATAYVVGNRVRQGGSVYKCIVAHTSGVFATDLADEKWEAYTGEDIAFEWEFPWTDTNTRIRTKLLSYIAMDTTGYGTFTLQVFVDKLLRDEDGNFTPALELEFVGGDSEGYGGGSGEYEDDQPYGSGRRTSDERLWGFPVEFKIVKFRISGATKGGLRVSSLSVLYKRGTYTRR